MQYSFQSININPPHHAALKSQRVSGPAASSPTNPRHPRRRGFLEERGSNPSIHSLKELPAVRAGVLSAARRLDCYGCTGKSKPLESWYLLALDNCPRGASSFFTLHT